jgi:hypothetical protein
MSTFQLKKLYTVDRYVYSTSEMERALTEVAAKYFRVFG